MRNYFILFIGILSLSSCSNDRKLEIIDEELGPIKIYSINNAHLAFTDLVFYNGNFYCSFRVAKEHVGDNGEIYLLTSKNAKDWNFLNSFKVEGIDLRDPKFVVDEEWNTLYLHIGGSKFRNGVFVEHNQFISKSQNGSDWEALNLINIKDKWLWKPIIHSNLAYAVGYKIGEELGLYKSSDLINYNFEKTLKLDPAGVLSEVAFTKSNDTLFAIVRKNYPGSYFGISKSPFHDWKWVHLDRVLGGPNIMKLGNRILISGRTYIDSEDNNCRSKTFLGEIIGGKIKILHILPSGGDTGYTGMVYKDEILYISYYSGISECFNTNDNFTEIYLAKIKL